MNNAVSGKIMKNVKNHRDIKLVVNKVRRNYIVPEAKYHTIKLFFLIYISNRNEKKHIYS